MLTASYVDTETLTFGLSDLHPLDLAAYWRHEPHVAVLGGCPDPHFGSWTFVCSDPWLLIEAKDGVCRAGPPNELSPADTGTFDALAHILTEHANTSTPAGPGYPPFVAGAVGWLGYELLHELEEVPRSGFDDLRFPDAAFAFFRRVVAFDHAAGTITVCATGHGAGSRSATEMSRKVLDATCREVAEAASAQSPHRSRHARLVRPDRLFLPQSRLGITDLQAAGITPLVSQDRYMTDVETCRQHILAGDAFEICLTQRFDTTFDGDEIRLYRSLCDVSPAPMSAWIKWRDISVHSSSPERFLRLTRDRWAESRPIKGTRPRGRDVEDDHRLAGDLASSGKDLAENMMIVDLVRNDLGRVCDIGTVHVPELRVIEHHPFTHQMVSTIRGRLSAGLGPVDLLRATFPGGSMTGAPKIAAMKIIDSIEPCVRGVFSGAIGWFDLAGTCDLNIVIRTMLSRESRLSFHTGGAVVVDSSPADEYQESLDKAHGMLRTLQAAKGRRDP